MRPYRVVYLPENSCIVDTNGQCRAPTGVAYVNKNRYSLVHVHTELVLGSLNLFPHQRLLNREGLVDGLILNNGLQRNINYSLLK
ncbi:hypothetical protein [Nostoc sp.]|uniref:hypothetical protein n=1 Tax=Nostoc sp. TaxID=1180 RepID=UPI002FF9BD43